MRLWKGDSCVKLSINLGYLNVSVWYNFIEDSEMMSDPKTSIPETLWVLSSPGIEAEKLSSELGIPLNMAQVLVNRKMCDPQKAHGFLYGTLEDLPSPRLMEGMDKAVQRIRNAVSRKEKILIFGDYDVDGVLSVVILTRVLRELGTEVEYFIPDRLREGYGIKEHYIEEVLKRKAGLVISVDCGIKADRFVQKAQQEGIDVIVTDHHQPGRTLPPAYVILNPVIEGCGYPDKNLAGIGVVFKLIQALLGKERFSQWLPYLKFVSIGTISDVVPLKGENRLFVRYGLQELGNAPDQGLESLMRVCGLRGKNVSVGDVGFRIGPRINAAGRMGLTDKALQLFFSSSAEKADELAGFLNGLNSKRQKVEEKITRQALKRIRDRYLDKRYKFLILGCEEWHRGVIGVVASKIKQFYHRPVILFSYQDGKASGSGRSIEEISMIDYLERHKEFFLSYGGHPMAVGCELNHERMGPFKKAMNTYVQSRITPDCLKRKIFIDSRLDLRDVDSSFLDNLRLFSPYGVGNPRPLFLSHDVKIIERPKKMGRKHCKFLVNQGGRIFEALGWHKEGWIDFLTPGERVDLVYSFQFSQYLGEEKINLAVEDVKK